MLRNIPLIKKNHMLFNCIGIFYRINKKAVFSPEFLNHQNINSPGGNVSIIVRYKVILCSSELCDPWA